MQNQTRGMFSPRRMWELAIEVGAAEVTGIAAARRAGIEAVSEGIGATPGTQQYALTISADSYADACRIARQYGQVVDGAF